ncbi:hypothetical protein [Methanosarcina vacuolata]|uniref:hypothetical protein n=1 Tax=Methanosarcina vacuolata TaxID=2215 RepID=UPI000A9291BC|nr:hypothetical protein [Methanosarcina vacuolata]
MNWFTDIPKGVLLISSIIFIIGVIVFINSLDIDDSRNSNQNLKKTTEYLTDNIVPTEINWISWLVVKLSKHPFLLLGSILVTLWFFGYFLPKDS